jgi:hypothetical protein
LEGWHGTAMPFIQNPMEYRTEAPDPGRHNHGERPDILAHSLPGACILSRYGFPKGLLNRSFPPPILSFSMVSQIYQEGCDRIRSPLVIFVTYRPIFSIGSLLIPVANLDLAGQTRLFYRRMNLFYIAALRREEMRIRVRLRFNRPSL